MQLSKMFGLSACICLVLAAPLHALSPESQAGIGAGFCGIALLVASFMIWLGEDGPFAL